MLNGLDRIDWAGLQHAYGPAADTPAALRAIALGGRSQAAQALAKLADTLCHQGTRYTATVAAIPYIVELTQRRGPCVSGLLHLLRDIAAPTCDQILQQGVTEQQFQHQAAQAEAAQSAADRDHARTYGASPQVDAHCHSQVSEHLPALTARAQDRNPATTAAALALLGEFPAAWETTRPALTAALDSGGTPAVQRSAMAALGRLGQSIEAGPVDPILRPWLSPRHALPLRAEAALAMTSRDPARYDTMRDALTQATVLYRNDSEERPVYGRPGWTASRLAGGLARSRGEDARQGDTITAILAALPQARAQGATTDPLIRAALATLAFGAPIDAMFRGRRRSSLTDLERTTLKAVAEHGDWQIGNSRNGTFAGLMRRCGLPDTPQEMARFATPPGALGRLLRR